MNKSFVITDYGYTFAVLYLTSSLKNGRVAGVVNGAVC
jgi:hypothetical protein